MQLGSYATAVSTGCVQEPFLSLMSSYTVDVDCVPCGALMCCVLSNPASDMVWWVLKAYGVGRQFSGHVGTEGCSNN